jgi:hypothetical protein
VVDGWLGYAPLKKEYKNMRQIPSDDGKNFPDLHIHIVNLKGWLQCYLVKELFVGSVLISSYFRRDFGFTRAFG